jgi:CRISPR-associated protein Csm5
MREVVPAMCSGAFAASLTIQQLGKLSHTTLNGKPISPQNDLPLPLIVKFCNDFYVPLLQQELQMLKQLHCLHEPWLALIDDLLNNELATLFKAGHTMLLRVGRHSGAEGVTIDGARNIKIMKGKGNSTDYLDHATTIWLAGDVAKSNKGLLPFGWVLIEIDPSDTPVRLSLHAKLRQFNRALCEQQQATLAVLDAKKAEIIEAQQALAAKAAEEKIREAETLARREEKEAQLAAMSDEARTMAELIERMNNGEDKGRNAGCAFAADAAGVADLAVNWAQPDKLLMHDLLIQLAEHFGINVKKQDKWKKRLKALKDEQ